MSRSDEPAPRPPSTPGNSGAVTGHGPRRGISVGRKSLFAALVLLLVCVLAELGGIGLERALPPPKVGGLAALELPPKGPGARRVLVFGGSAAAGFPLPELGFVEQLRFRIEREHPEAHIEIFNLSMGGRAADYCRAMLERGLRASPDLLIVMTGNNEFLDFPTAGGTGRLDETLQVSAAYRLLRRAVRPAAAPLPPGEGASDEYFRPRSIEPVSLGDGAWRRRVRRFARELATMRELADEAAVPLLLLTPPANLRDWPPAYRRISGAKKLSAAAPRIDEALRALDFGETAPAAAAAEALTGLADEDLAIVLYLRGRVHMTRGEIDEARSLLRAARDLDPVPRRATWELLDCLRETVAAGGGGVALLDTAAAVDAADRAGIAGFDTMGDNCHPLVKGHWAVADVLMEDLRRRGWIGLPTEAVSSMTDFLESAQGGPGRSELAQTAPIYFAMYSMKPPFFNNLAARRWLDEAARSFPGDWTVMANLATLDLIEGDIAMAKNRLRAARSALGTPLDPTRRDKMPQLLDALREHDIGDVNDWLDDRP